MEKTLMKFSGIYDATRLFMIHRKSVPRRFHGTLPSSSVTPRAKYSNITIHELTLST
jgi:hypothetical protein